MINDIFSFFKDLQVFKNHIWFFKALRISLTIISFSFNLRMSMVGIRITILFNDMAIMPFIFPNPRVSPSYNQNILPIEFMLNFFVVALERITLFIPTWLDLTLIAINQLLILVQTLFYIIGFSKFIFISPNFRFGHWGLLLYIFIKIQYFVLTLLTIIRSMVCAIAVLFGYAVVFI